MSNYIQRFRNPKTGKKQRALCLDDYFESHQYGFAFRKDGKDCFDDSCLGFVPDDYDFFTEEEVFGEEDILPSKNAIPSKKQIEFIKEFNYISVSDLEEILEYLEDNDLLSEKGKDFRKEFWEIFTKE